MNNSFDQFGWMYSRWYRVISWIIVSALIIGVIFTVVSGRQFSLSGTVFTSLVNTFVLWTGSIYIVRFIWRSFPWEDKPVQHIIVEVTLIIGFLCVYVLAMNTFLCYKNDRSFIEGIKANVTDIFFTAMITFFIVTIHEAVFFYRQWKYHFSKSIRLEKDNLQAHYNALKAQVNPHFLFNSLNSLMSLIDNNPKAEKYVQDLSEYLRYVLLSNEKTQVTLNEEIENLQKFFDLQKLRYNNNLQVEMNIEEHLLHFQIPPLTLQMLVDNCIKHNIITSKNPLKIRIFNNADSITVWNNKQLKNNVASTAQGLKNIEGRYRFISNELVRVHSDNDSFSVTIPLITDEGII